MHVGANMVSDIYTRTQTKAKYYNPTAHTYAKG